MGSSFGIIVAGTMLSVAMICIAMSINALADAVKGKAATQPEES